MDEDTFYDDDVDIGFEGNFNFQDLLSEDEEDDHPYNNEFDNDIELEETFNIRQNNNIASVVEKHESYLIRLKESDRRLRPIPPLQLLNSQCKCGQRCDALLSHHEICQMRMNWPLCYRDRIAAQFYVLKTLMCGKEFFPFIKGYRVCMNFFCTVNIIPIGRAQRFIELINEGVNNPVHPNTGRRFERQTTIEKLARIAMYIDDTFESNPAKNSYLPSSRITKCTAAGEALNIPVKDRRKYNFTRLFRKLACNTHFISGNDLTKCKICSEYSFAIRKTSLCSTEKAKIQLEWEEHKMKIRNDRRDYKFRCLLSLEKPFEYCSIVHDGMSKMKTKLPLNNDHRSKSIVDNDRMFCNLNLAIMHQKNGNNKTTTIGFFSPGSCYDNSTNAIISQIIYSISTLPAVPATVFIQIDNFPGNKSYIFNAAFAYLLLCQTAIREFYVSFLLPGHTHCDVDARFGNFSTYLNAKECGSPQELMSAFLECIPGQAHMKQSIYNFKETLAPYCKNYGIKSMYDFHIYLNGKNEPMVENARFKLSENLLCGQRQKEDSMVSEVFKKTPPLDLQFQIDSPDMGGIEKMIPNIHKWEKVISETAQNDLLSLNDEIKEHVGTPFTTLLQTIQEKAVTLQTLQTNENTTSGDPVVTEEISLSTVADENENTADPSEINVDTPIVTRRSERLRAAASAQTTPASRKRKAPASSPS